MAWLQPDAHFDPDAFDAPVVGICSALGDHDSGEHRHGRGQVLFTRQGCVRIQAPGRLCLLPPTQAAWIPAGLAHRARMRETVDYRSLYFSPTLGERLPREVTILSVNPLLRELLERIAQAPFDTAWSAGAQAHLLALCLDELQRAPRQPMFLPLPGDRRLAGLVERLDQLPPALGELARHVGASEKTISRVLRRDTGMSYQQWRQQWRLLRAVEQLALQRPLGDIAEDLGFASDSAFIAFFRGMTGTTPGAYSARQA
ncbi:MULTISPECIES: helix-turn-helix transcriptional regulator [unclassified Pseudomonas]|uniref:AraC family transcriptional regulator n=1 Tax=unclassified Pseudomonas TaxID=196821 RepID=UPI00244B4128|nr:MULTISPECIES: helix-turn-helix transcriptional regulator [unclassified Pseudomonas]MDH0303679.1 helix-turn-helix transcriptional regulator [Pseudomonas sp. GD04091]MDH1986703.1 helix-turn-helix transcriptional regulator [Pseudomonas sp. GD03689]